jgi:MEMO1 family protein
MPSRLPRLRRGLDLSPSPLPDRPGLLIRDPFKYGEHGIIFPPHLASGLVLFDGESTFSDLIIQVALTTGEVITGEVIASMVSVLSENCFLETPEFEARRRARHAEFARARVRRAAYAGSGYPSDETELRHLLDEFSTEPGPRTSTSVGSEGADGQGTLVGLAAPHVSPDGGWHAYSSAYSNLAKRIAADARDLTIVLLGTSHYGQPERFGLTRKAFRTPLGKLKVDDARFRQLSAQAGESIVLEDYCHAIEHSIEFQCVFLQHALGSDFKILPILCGAFADATMGQLEPERDDRVKRFFDALAALDGVDGRALLWVLGVDMAHMGRRYGDPFDAHANEGEMLKVAVDDRNRIDAMCAGDADSFLNLVVTDSDPLKWCGFSPIYTFMRVHEGVCGNLVRYEQWNIDPASVVSFAAVDFHRT